ncbi:MAG: TlpA disulfide reductase family protein [Candidatus Kapabacteria bacterium]|nr:TlpA disulfide reductase family protein [Candidatus Kapabacteria bacterium]
MKHKIILLVIAISIFSFACNKNSETPKVNTAGMNSETSVAEPRVFNTKEVMLNTPSKKVEFSWNENGTMMTFSQYTKGKVVFLNFWGTWCPPCRREIPDIIKLQKDLLNKDFVVIGVANERDQEKAVANVKAFASKQGVNYLNIVDQDSKLSSYYGQLNGEINAVPTTFILDKNGAVVEKVVGGMDYDSFYKLVEKYISK